MRIFLLGHLPWHSTLKTIPIQSTGNSVKDATTQTPQQYKRAALTNFRDWSVAKPTVPCSSSPSLQETVSRSKFCGHPLLYAVLRWKSKCDAPHKRWTCQCRFDSKVNATFWQRLLEPWTSQKASALHKTQLHTRTLTYSSLHRMPGSGKRLLSQALLRPATLLNSRQWELFCEIQVLFVKCHPPAFFFFSSKHDVEIPMDLFWETPVKWFCPLSVKQVLIGGVFTNHIGKNGCENAKAILTQMGNE